MNAQMKNLIQASAQGNKQAFGKIVERYQGAVSAMAYSVTGDLGQSEDLAQETFVIAWKRLGSLHKRESIAAWLCGIARNLARDWMRKQSKSPTVPLESVPELTQPVIDSIEESRLRQERSETVWTALADIPEMYREPLILFYRQDRSIRDIAEALDLSEDCVKQRLSRGRKMLREEVARLVEDTLEESRPGKAFTAGVLAALPPWGMTGTLGTGVDSMGAMNAPSILGLAVKGKALAIAALALLTLGGLWYGRVILEPAERTSRAVATPRNPITYLPESPHQEAQSALDAGAETKNIDSVTQDGAAVSGVVVFRDSGEAAGGMRVELRTKDGDENAVLTDVEGRFAFSGIAPGECVLVAYDARYDEVPEDGLRSKHVELSLSEGETKNDVHIEVPPRGGQITGRVYDKKTGAPLSGISVEAFRVGARSYTGKSNGEGDYTIVGLAEGEWRVRVDSNNPVFSSSLIETMYSIFLEPDGTAQLDIAIDRGIPIGGQVVNPDGETAPDAGVNADLFLADGRGGLSCYFRTDAEGRFTVLGAAPGDRAVLSALKDDLKSHIAVVNPVPDKAVEDVVLVLLPAVGVMGRFVDENGRSVKANFWWRAVHPDGSDIWRGQGENPAETFEIMLAQGEYEVKGQPEGNNFGVEQPAQPLHVGTTSVSNVTIRVVTKSELVGEYALRGVVIDEEGKPLRDTRVYIDGESLENRHSFQETHTDENGRFSFNGLLDAQYRVHATPDEPFEKFAGLDAVNPADTPEITIVARLAAWLRGRVLDAQTGEPITKFRVEYGGLALFGRESPWERRSISSETGVFALPARLGQDWYVRMAADGYTEALETGSALSSGETVDGLDFRLSPGRIIRGTVTNEEGGPVAGALVYHNEDVFDFSRQSPRYAAAQTDAEGRFELRSLPAEALFLYALKSGYAIAQAGIDEEVRIVLRQGGVIEGRILIGGAVPQGGTSVAAMAPDTHHNRWAKMEENGHYVLTELMDAEYRLQLNLKDDTGNPIGSYAVEEPIEAASGTTVTYDITIPLGAAAVEGTLTQNGVPAGAVALRCRRGGYETSSSTDEMGHYRFDALPPGPVQIDILTLDEEEPGTWGYRNILDLEVRAAEELRQDCELAEE